MTNPIDYTSAFADVPQPQQAFVQGIKDGAGIQALQLQQQQQQAQVAQQQQMRADLATLSQNPTTQAIGAMSIKYPALSENFKRSFDILEPGQKQARLDQATQVYAALHNGQPDIAQELLTKQATAARNGGSEQDAKSAETMAELIKVHPEFAQTTAGLMLSSALGPDKFAAAFPAMQSEQRASDLAPATLAKAKADATKSDMEARVAIGTAPDVIKKAALSNAELESQITDRSKRFALDSDKFQTETQIKLAEMKQKFGQLPEFVAKDVNAAATDSIAAQQSATKMTTLADQLEREAGALGSGVTAKAGELWKSTFGSQNDLTRLRAEYTRIVTPAALGAYKQVTSGTTSDRDIETAMKGVPSDTASPEMMVSFLRGTAKLQAYDAILNNAKSEWLGAVQNLNKAKADVEIDGVKVAAGTTFKQFTDQYLQRKVNETVVKGRSYMRHDAGAQTGGASANF